MAWIGQSHAKSGRACLAPAVPFRFLLRMLRAADSLAQTARMIAIESFGDGLRERRHLFRIRHQHRRPSDGLQGDPIQPDRETKHDNDESASDSRKHSHNATRSRVHRSTSDDKWPRNTKAAVYALLKPLDAEGRIVFRRPICKATLERSLTLYDQLFAMKSQNAYSYQGIADFILLLLNLKQSNATSSQSGARSSQANGSGRARVLL